MQLEEVVANARPAMHHPEATPAVGMLWATHDMALAMRSGL